MRILIFNTTAQYGSTGKIAQILQKGYENAGHHATICYGRNMNLKEPSNAFRFTFKFEKYLTYLHTRIWGISGGCLFFSMRRLFHFMDNERPELVHLLNIHGYYVDEYALLGYLKKKQVPTIYTMCDEYAYTAKCGFALGCEKYKTFCHNCELKRSYPASWFFDRSKTLFNMKSNLYNGYQNLIFAGCGFVYNRAKESCLLGDKKLIRIGEPIDLDNVFYPRSVSALRDKLRIPKGNKVVLTAAVLSNYRKGGRFFLDLCRIMDGMNNYTFVYVGFDTNDYNDITPHSVIKIPYLESLDKLAEFMSMADVFISTTLTDTVPNAAINALGCGTPVCAFDIGGMSSIRKIDKDVLKIVPLYDITQLKDAVLSVGEKTEDLKRRCRELVYGDFSSESVLDKYLDIINECAG